MSLLDLIRGIPERMRRGQERNIGGLLGIDPEDMTEQERQQARRLSQMAVFDAMARGTTPTAGLAQAAQLIGSQRQARMEREASDRAAQDVNQASAAIAALLGGRGVDVGPQTVLEEVSPMSGMNLPALLASPAGAAAVQANPLLAELLKQRTGQQVVGGSIYDRWTGQFITPTEYTYQNVEGVGLVAVNRSNPADTKIVQRVQPPKPEQKSQFNVLSAQEAAAAGFAPGTVVQRNPETGQLSVLQRAMSLPDPRGFNDRQRSGANVLQDNVLNYASNLTGLPKSKLANMTPEQVERAVIERGGRITQGGVARAIRGIPFAGQGILDTLNPDLAAAATAGGAAIAMIQNPTGPITGPDVEIGKLQFPGPIYPVEVQAQMLRDLLKQISAPEAVEQYDARGNKIGQERRGASGNW